MKNSKEIIHKRQKNIIDYLNKNKIARTTELANILNTSLITIRRDFDVLENNGILKRSYGYATLVENSLDIILDCKNTLTTKEKIAKKAAEFVNNQDTLFINSSSTAIMMLKYIKNKNIFVITNNSNVLKMELCPKIKVILTGGELYGEKKSMVGDIAVNTLSKIKANKAFLGVSGVHSEDGISTAILQEVCVNQKMLSNCFEVFIVCDNSKIGVHHNFLSGDISQVNYLITDSCSDNNLNRFKNIDIGVILCES